MAARVAASAPTLAAAGAPIDTQVALRANGAAGGWGFWVDMRSAPDARSSDAGRIKGWRSFHGGNSGVRVNEITELPNATGDKPLGQGEKRPPAARSAGGGLHN